MVALSNDMYELNVCPESTENECEAMEPMSSPPEWAEERQILEVKGKGKYTAILKLILILCVW